MEHGYGSEHNNETMGGRLQQWHIEGWQRDDGSERNNVDTRQFSGGWAGSGVEAKGHGNREVEADDNNLIVIPLLHWPL